MVAELIERLKTGNPAERKAAAQSLGELGPEATAAREALVEALIDQCSQVRFAAAEAIEKVGLDANSAFTIVSDIFNEGEEERHYSSIVALHALGLYGDKAVEMVSEWLRHPSSDTRYVGVQFLEFISVGPSIEAPLLVELVKHETDEWTMNAVLGRIRCLPSDVAANVVASLPEILKPEVAVVEVIDFLGSVSSPEARMALENLLESEQVEWRLKAARVLLHGHGGNCPRAVAVLQKLKDQHPDGEIRARAEIYLASVAD